MLKQNINYRVKLCNNCNADDLPTKPLTRTLQTSGKYKHQTEYKLTH